MQLQWNRTKFILHTSLLHNTQQQNALFGGKIEQCNAISQTINLQIASLANVEQYMKM